ncbi:MAG: FAD-dependent oxidoreductase [Actinobacteria bacterium]|nr:FAD-dependent oxidoreductase [Actinomycetota bacterium]
MNFSRAIDVVAEPDVLVVGAGSAGTAAALAAARHGASTVLIERCGFAGGYISAVLGMSFDGMVDLRSGLPVVGGIVFEFIEHAGVYERQPPGLARPDPATTRFAANSEIGQINETPDRAVIKIDVERFKLTADRLFRQAGVRVLYHTVAADAIRKGDRVDSVVIANKGGLGLIRPKMVVDASGDADVAAWAGAPYDLGLDVLQPMSLHFRIGNVQPDPDVKQQCFAAAQRAHADGKLPLFGGPWMNRWPSTDRDLMFNATRVPGNPIDPDDLSGAEMQGREDARVMFEYFKAHVPAFSDAYFVTSGPMVGVRESRRIRGDRTLSLADIEESRAYDDVICMGNWWLDRHPKDRAGKHPLLLVRPYDIAHGTLLPQGLANVWVAGRCHSAEPEAQASSRVNVTCMGMGQAAGTAAAMAATGGHESRTLSVPALQAALLADGGIILERARSTLKVGDALADRVAKVSMG